MRNMLVVAIAAMGLGICGVNAANAAVSYAVDFSGATLRDYNGDTIGSYDGSFSFVTASAITAAGSAATTSCSLSPAAAALYDCSATQDFDPDYNGSGVNFIGFNSENLDLSGGGTGFLFFDAGSFLANGVYSLSLAPPPGYGSFAQVATLTVSGIGSTTPATGVPEPASLMLLGMGLLGFAARRRRV